MDKYPGVNGDKYPIKEINLDYEYPLMARVKVASVTEYNSEDLYVVWFSKTLQNWKALVSTDRANGKYWEVTHNGDKHETYVDEYRKVRNVVVEG